MHLWGHPALGMKIGITKGFLSKNFMGKSAFSGAEAGVFKKGPEFFLRHPARPFFLFCPFLLP